jgi:hypothetical protein
MTPERIKVTTPPPPLCEGCFWRTKYLRLKGRFLGLRKDLIRSRVEVLKFKRAAAEAKAERAASRFTAGDEAAEARPRRHAPDAEAEIMDLVESYNMGGIS